MDWWAILAVLLMNVGGYICKFNPCVPDYFCFTPALYLCCLIPGEEPIVLLESARVGMYF